MPIDRCGARTPENTRAATEIAVVMFMIASSVAAMRLGSKIRGERIEFKNEAKGAAIVMVILSPLGLSGGAPVPTLLFFGSPAWKRDGGIDRRVERAWCRLGSLLRHKCGSCGSEMPNRDSSYLNYLRFGMDTLNL